MVDPTLKLRIWARFRWSWGDSAVGLHGMSRSLRHRQINLGNGLGHSFNNNLAQLKGTISPLGAWTRLFPRGAGRADGTASLPNSKSTHLLQRNCSWCRWSQEAQFPGGGAQAKPSRHQPGCQEALCISGGFCLSEAKTNKQKQLLDLENVPENPAKDWGEGWAGDGELGSGLTSPEPCQPPLGADTNSI